MPFVVIALGGNLENPVSVLKKALEKLCSLGSDFKASKLYWTKPVSPFPQDLFLNGVCRFFTELSLDELFLKMEEIELQLGKVKKAKDLPRLIDLDLIFYGESACEGDALTLPHPRWKERLFVLVPLLDLMQTVQISGVEWSIKKMMENFPEKEIQEVYDNEARSY